MAEAGYPDGFRTRYDVRQVGSYSDQCAVIKRQLEDVLGIQGDLTVHPNTDGFALFDAARAADSKGDWEMACQAQGQPALDVDPIIGAVYRRGGARNYTDWSNAQVDRGFDLQKAETDPAKRREIQKEIELFLFSQRDNHWITLGWGVSHWIIGEDIRGFNAPRTLQYGFKHEDLWLDR